MQLNSTHSYLFMQNCDRAFFFSFLLLFSAIPDHAQQAWQHLQIPTAHSIARRWAEPAPEYGPEPYYGLNGSVTIEQIGRDLDTMHRMGFQAVTVQAGYGMLFAYLSDEYFAFFRKFVLEAKRRHMRVWIVDDAGYPSGFAGGRFTTDAPALRMQALEIEQRIPVSAGAHVKMHLSNTVVSAAAVNQSGSAMPVPLTDSTLDWTAPEGDWTLLLAAHEFRTSPTRSDTNPHRVKDASQSLEDYLNPQATQQYLAFTHERYKRFVGDEFGKTILGFRGDEPDYSISGLPWTPAFFEEFRRLKGYDVQPYVAMFAQTPSHKQTLPTIHLTAEQLRIQADYYDVFSQMFAKSFFEPQGQWCAANHLEYQVHLNHEESQMDLVRSEGDFLRDMRLVQVPGIDAIWHQIWKDTISDYPRLASSAAHLYGRPRSFTESFAAYRPNPDVDMARYILNEQFVRGINQVEMMYFPSSASGTSRPSAYMQDPEFPALTQYAQRMSYVMSMGRPDTTVALLLPSSSLWLGSSRTNEQFVSAERLLSEHQIDFDIVNEDALATELVLHGGSFATQSGNSYRTVILPDPVMLSRQAAARLRSFSQAGGKVVFLGNLPDYVYGQSMRDAVPISPSELSWATQLNDQLPATPTPPAYPPAQRPQPLDLPALLTNGIGAAIVEPAVRTATRDTALRVMKRKWKDADCYLFFNEGDKTIDDTITFLSEGRTVEVWDAQTGTITQLQTQRAGHNPEVHLALQPYTARILVVR